MDSTQFRPLTPIWGEGPPPKRATREVGEVLAMNELQNRLRRGPYPILLLVLLVGLALLYAATKIDDPWGAALDALGTALVIATVLAATVDLWLKRQLLRDAFQATFGYMLPEELRDEVRWIYSQTMVCTRHEQRMELAPIADDAGLVVLKARFVRDVRNISDRPTSVTPGFALDEWGPDRPSEIISLGYRKGKETLSDFEMTRSAGVVSASLPEVEIQPGEEMTMWAEGFEVKGAADAFHLVCDPATRKPRVTIDGPPGFDYTVSFGNRTASDVIELGRGTWELPGTLLPGQVVNFRWWRTESG